MAGWQAPSPALVHYVTEGCHLQEGAGSACSVAPVLGVPFPGMILAFS